MAITPDPDPALVGRLQASFAHFATHAFADEPLYAAIAEAASTRPAWAALLAAAPPPQQSPLLWLAALQDRVLELVDLGARPALADWYASAGGTRAPDAALVGVVDAFLVDHREPLVERIATRTTQTNEIGRCAVLWPLLQSLDAPRLALLDVGCSAGLNLGVDRWRYRYLDDASGATIGTRVAGRDPRVPEVACRVLSGTLPPDDVAPAIALRAGVDLDPVDVHDAAGVRWLRACLWPHDAPRRERFDAAVDVARESHWALSAIEDPVAAIDAWLAGLPPDVLPVVFNSWVLAYFDADLLRRHVDHLRQAVAERGLTWISAEDPALSRRWWPELPDRDAARRANATSWTVARPDGGGGVRWRLGAISHAHGRWMLYEG